MSKTSLLLLPDARGDGAPEASRSVGPQLGDPMQFTPPRAYALIEGSCDLRIDAAADASRASCTGRMRTPARVERVQLGSRSSHREHHRELQRPEILEQSASCVLCPDRRVRWAAPRTTPTNPTRDRPVAARAAMPDPLVTMLRLAMPGRGRAHAASHSSSSAAATSRMMIAATVNAVAAARCSPPPTSASRSEWDAASTS